MPFRWETVDFRSVLPLLALPTSDGACFRALFLLQEAAKATPIRRSPQSGFDSPRQRCVHGDLFLLSLQSPCFSAFPLDAPLLTDLLIGSDENMYNSYSFFCCAQIQIDLLQSLQTLDFGCFACYQTARLVCSSRGDARMTNRPAKPHLPLVRHVFL